MVQSELGAAAYSAAYSAAAAATSTTARRAGPDADAASDDLSAAAEWAQPPGPSWESSDHIPPRVAQVSLLTKCPVPLTVRGTSTFFCLSRG